MKKIKHITRNKLLKKPDEFITLSGKIFQYISHQKKPIAIIFTTFVIILLITLGFNIHLNKMELKAQNLLYQAIEVYNHENDNESLVKFKNIIDQFSHSQAADFASVYIGNYYYKIKDYDQSIIYFNNALDGNIGIHYINNSLLNSLAYCYLEKGNYEKAIDFFNKIIKKDGFYLTEEIYINLGRCYENLNNNDKATEVYQKLIDRYPNSSHLSLVEWKKNKLKLK